MRTELASLAYHEITDDVTSTGFQRASALAYKHPTRVFAAHLDAIARARRAPERVTELDPRDGRRHVLVTFDDGGRSALQASDELLRRGWRGHFFVVTGRLGSRTFLDVAGVRALHEAGHLVGTHSHSHPDIFCDLSDAQMDEEWRTSADRLAQILGAPCRLASLPGGDLSAAAIRSAARAGVRWLFTSEPELAPRLVDGCWVLGRVCAKRDTPLEDVEAWVAFRGWRRARLVRQGKVALRRALAPAYRWWMRAHPPV